MADVAKRIGPTALTAAAATIYTAPAGGSILRTLRVANVTSTPATFTMSIGADAAGKRLYSAVTIAGNSTLAVEMFMPLVGAEVVQAYSGTAAALTFTAGAIEL